MGRPNLRGRAGARLRPAACDSELAPDPFLDRGMKHATISFVY